MATLKLKKLECIRRNDLTGVDEPLIRVNGNTVWSGTISKGGEVGLQVRCDMGTNAEIELREMNGQHFKTIGTATIQAAQSDKEPVVFKTSGTHYKLYYAIE